MTVVLKSECGAQEDPTFDVVHARMLHHYSDLVAELGGVPSAVIARHSEAPVQEDSDVTYRQHIALLEAAAAELPCADFGLRLALRQGPAGIFGQAGEAMRHAPTFGHALQFMSSHHYVHSRAAFIWTKRDSSRGEFVIGQAMLLDGPLICIQAIEQIFLIGHLMAAELTEGQVRSRRIMFRHQPVSSLQTYRRYFGCEVLFGQPADAAVYFDRDLTRPTVGADPRAFEVALARIEEQNLERRAPLRSRVRVSVTHLLASGLCTRPHVAETMKLHPRTMDRRLEAEGTSFLQIRDDVRRDLLRYYVKQTGLDFADVSERLGFAEQSVMSRCSRKWFGVTPTQLRNQALPINRAWRSPAAHSS